MRYIITPTTKPDDRGRQSFTAEWDLAQPDAHGRTHRAQCLFGHVADHVAAIQAAGSEVELRLFKP